MIRYPPHVSREERLAFKVMRARHALSSAGFQKILAEDSWRHPLSPRLAYRIDGLWWPVLSLPDGRLVAPHLERLAQELRSVLTRAPQPPLDRRLLYWTLTRLILPWEEERERTSFLYSYATILAREYFSFGESELQLRDLYLDAMAQRSGLTREEQKIELVAEGLLLSLAESHAGIYNLEEGDLRLRIGNSHVKIDGRIDLKPVELWGPSLAYWLKINSVKKAKEMLKAEAPHEKERRLVEELQPAPDENPTTLYELQQLLLLASPAEREVLDLMIEGRTVTEAAKTLGIPPNRARQRLFSFRKKVSAVA